MTLVNFEWQFSPNIFVTGILSYIFVILTTVKLGYTAHTWDRLIMFVLPVIHNSCENLCTNDHIRPGIKIIFFSL